MKRFRYWIDRAAVICLLAGVGSALAQPAAGPPEWVTQGPTLGAGATPFEIPLETRASKLYAQVELGGVLRRFVVDTGSPSMIDQALVTELGLPVVGRSQGTDAHGVVIQSDIVQADLRIGGMTVERVPMFSADFSGPVALRALVGDGVLGSELLKLGAWQVDLRDGVLRFSPDAAALPSVKAATRVTLHDFGYPHAPIFNVRFAEHARSKAMFDTGSPGYFAISPPDLDGARSAGGIGQTIPGFGSPGASLGGQAPDGPQLQVEMTRLSLDSIRLGRVGAVRRERSPSLLGARWLEHFIITLDVPRGAAYWLPYTDEPFETRGFGLALSFTEAVSVALVWEGSAAAAAGLRPGMVLTAINGEPATLTESGIAFALEALEGDSIELEWAGGVATLSRKTGVLE